MKFFLYRSRKGQIALFPYSRAGWDAARQEQDDDNRVTLKEIVQATYRKKHGIEDYYGYAGAYEGGFERGSFYIDDGGDIHTIELREV